MDDEWLQWRLRTRTPASAVDVPVQVVYDAMVKEVLSPGSNSPAPVPARLAGIWICARTTCTTSRWRNPPG
jgi:hypothetical protein